jgi:hypothetical protein
MLSQWRSGAITCPPQALVPAVGAVFRQDDELPDGAAALVGVESVRLYVSANSLDKSLKVAF